MGQRSSGGNSWGRAVIRAFLNRVLETRRTNRLNYGDDDRSRRRWLSSAVAGLLAIGNAAGTAAAAEPWPGASEPNVVASASSLTESQKASTLLDLLRDPDRRVRLAAIEAARAAEPNSKLQMQIEHMAMQDADPLVKGNARLLATEMKHGLTGRSAPPQVTTNFIDQPEELPFGSASVRPVSEEVPQPEAVVAPAPIDPRFVAPAENDHLPTLRQENALSPIQPFWSADSPDGHDPRVARPADGSPVRIGSYWDQVEASPISDYDGNALMTPNGFAASDPPPGFADGDGDDVLARPLTPPFQQDEIPFYDPVYADEPPYIQTAFEPPNGFSGPSSILPREGQSSNHFVPVEDRWRIGYPEWDRYGRNHPVTDDYPFVKGHWWDPYNQNVLKGDYPIMGQHTFMNVTLQNRLILNFANVPTATTPFESTRASGQEEFFGDGNFDFVLNTTSAQITLFHGNTAVFKPLDWQLRVTPVVAESNLYVGELAGVNPDVRKGRQRIRSDFALEEWFGEVKLADLSPDYDFLSVRAGSQFFNSDFRGLIFADINRSIRLFGTNFGNRDQFNLILFDQTEKDTNTLLNTFEDRHQNTLIANYYRQDFVFPGYTAQFSYHFNDDGPSTEFDKNNFLVRPDPIGVFQPHRVTSHYFGFAGDGHIGRINVSNAFYWVTGDDSRNPIAGEKQDINANMQAFELSIDRDWVRFRTSFFRASGDDDPFDDQARGFDAIFDNPNFVGGEFSYWQRQAIRLFGVNVTNVNSLVANLRSSKFQGQTNFVNPGIDIVNFGMDFEVTPKLKVITNYNYLWFDTTEVLEVVAFQDDIDPEIGVDISMGIEYRPLLNDNIILVAGLASLIPGAGFDDLFGRADTSKALTGAGEEKVANQYSNFVELILTY